MVVMDVMLDRIMVLIVMPVQTLIMCSQALKSGFKESHSVMLCSKYNLSLKLRPFGFLLAVWRNGSC